MENTSWAKRRELSLATGESPHVVVARAQVKAIEQVTGKLTKLSPGGFGWFHIKQAVKSLKQARKNFIISSKRAANNHDGQAVALTQEQANELMSYKYDHVDTER